MTVCCDQSSINTLRVACGRLDASVLRPSFVTNSQATCDALFSFSLMHIHAAAVKEYLSYSELHPCDRLVNRWRGRRNTTVPVSNCPSQLIVRVGEHDGSSFDLQTDTTGKMSAVVCEREVQTELLSGSVYLKLESLSR